MLAIRAARMFDGLRLHDRPQILVAGDRIADIDVTGAQPPAGYQTPSPNFAYGTGPKESLVNKEFNPAAGKYGD